MKTIVIRHKQTGEIKTFKHVYDTRCLVNVITGEESYYVLVFRNSQELKLDLSRWEIAIVSGESEDLSDPVQLFPVYDQFDILCRLAYSLKDADLSALADLLDYDSEKLSSDIDFLVDYSTIPFSSDDLPF